MTRRRPLLRVAASLALPADIAPRRPDRADAFVDAAGVNVHLSSPPYADRPGDVLRRVAELGVRHLRDELRPDDDLRRWRDLSSHAGVRAHLLVSPATNTVAEMIDYLAALPSGAVSAVEGQNEGDSDWFKAQPAARPSWDAAVVAYQRDVFAALQARWGRERPTVLSPTVLDYKPDDVRSIAAAAPFCDAVALHAYPQGWREPETDAPFAGLDWYLREFRDPFKPGAPAMTTETGYRGGTGGVPPSVAARYAPRLLLHGWSVGIVRTFWYELMDEGPNAEDPEANWGLLRSDGEPKPAFPALRGLLGALADPGPSFLPPPLAIRPLAAPPDLRLAPFAKRDGEVVVAVWRVVPVWDDATGRERAVAPVPVQLVLSRRFADAAALLLDGTDRWRPLASPTDTVTIAVGGVVTLLRFRP